MAQTKKKAELNAADLLANVGEAVTASHTKTEQQAKRGRRPGDPSKREKRMNIAISEDLKDYLTIMSKLRGVSMNDLVKEILQASLDDNQELFEKCRDLASSLAHKRRDII